MATPMLETVVGPCMEVIMPYRPRLASKLIAPPSAAGELPLDLGDLRQAADVALLAGVARSQERREHLGRDQRADHPAAHAEHVAVVVLDGLVARVGVMADEGADAGELAGRDRHARPRAAYDHRALRLPG